MERKALILAAGIVMAGASFALAADKPMSASETGKMLADQAAVKKEEMMAKMKEYTTPNENHKVLDAFVGDWTYTSKHWMSADSPAEESTGTASAKWVMDGRFVQIDVQGTMMGQPFNGVQLVGYDNAGKEYQSIWYDSMGTGMMVTSGSYDAASKTLTQNGMFNCPLRGKIDMRWMSKIIDANSYTFEMYGPDENGKEFKGMEIVYTKKQPVAEVPAEPAAAVPAATVTP